MNNLKDKDLQWIFKRSIIDGPPIKVFIRRLARLIKSVLGIHNVIFMANVFDIKLLNKSQNIESCVTLTKQKPREVNIIESALSDVNVSDILISKKLQLSSIGRLLNIFYLFKKSYFTNIVDVAEIYDFSQNANFIKKSISHDFFVSHDGSTPISRLLCLIFNENNKDTVRVLGHGSGPKVERLFKYNFLLKSFSGVVDDGWRVVCGIPWKLGNKNYEIDSNIVGVIGNPGPYYIFGLEYWMLPIMLNLKKCGYIVKVRLHPQAHSYSKYMLRLLNITVSDNEDEAQFINSLSHLITTYRSTLIDLSVIYGCPVIQNNINISTCENKNGITQLNLGNYKMLEVALQSMRIRHKLKERGKTKCKSIRELVFDK